MKDLWVSLSGAVAQQRKVESIANNIANSNTPGFKKDDLVFKEHLTALNKAPEEISLPREDWKPQDFYRSYGAERAYVQVDGKFTSFKQGQLTPTSNPLDFAIQGDGFFEILTPNGIRYSRKGSFSLNQEGALVTDQGFPVLSQLKEAGNQEAVSPKERIIKLVGKKIAVTNNGDMYSNNQNIGKLSLVEFNSPHALSKEGQSLFINPYPNNIKDNSENSKVHQGFVEESNVNAVAEMSELIKANRHFETIQKAIKTYDSISGTAVNDILKF